MSQVGVRLAVKHYVGKRHNFGALAATVTELYPPGLAMVFFKYSVVIFLC